MRLPGRAGESAPDAVAGVVDQDVGGADERLDDRLGGGRIGEVGGNTLDLDVEAAAEILGDLFKPVPAPGGDGEVAAPRGRCRPRRR